MQPHLLAHRLVQLERQRLGAVEQLQLLREQLDLAGAQVRVRGGARPRAHQPRHADHELVAQPLGFLEHLGRIRIEHHLQQPLAVAQVHEDDAAVIAPPMHPAGHGDLLPGELFVDVSAIVSAHGTAVRERERAILRRPPDRASNCQDLRGRSGPSPRQRSASRGLGGTTTPQVMIIFIAASTRHLELDDLSRGTMTMKPDVGFGVVGT